MQFEEYIHYKSLFKRENRRALSEMLDLVINSESIRDIEMVERKTDTFGGLLHIKNVFKNAYNIIKKTKKRISDKQILLLGYAIFLHDIGKIVNNRNHAEESAKMIREKWREYKIDNEHYAEIVARIVESHSFGSINIQKISKVSHRNIYFGICCIILRLADELDCTSERTHPAMKDNAIKVRLRSITEKDIIYDVDNMSIGIEIYPKDICVWNWIPNYETYLNSILDNEINSSLLNNFSHIDVYRLDESLKKNSFWTKLVDLDMYNDFSINIVFGIVGEIPKYKKQDIWNGSLYSIWDINAMTNMMVMAQKINPNIRIDLKHVVMDRDISNQLSGYTDIFMNNTIVIGSPKMNALSEFLISKAFDVQPFCYDDYKNARLFRFSWPKNDVKDKEKKGIPLSTFLYENETTTGIYYGTVENPELRAKTVIPDDETTERPDCALIIIIKYLEKYHIVLSGMSGPGTLVSSMSLCDCELCYQLEIKEIMDHLKNGRAIFILIKSMVTKNNKDAFKNRHIKSIVISKVWYFDKSEKTLHEILIKR